MKTINTYINEKLRLTATQKYTCQPKDRDELRGIIIDRIKKEGPECDLNDIDTSKITDMKYLFNASEYFHDGDEIFKKFNGDISQWDVSNVENMDAMFYRCEQFNQYLKSWDVSNVKNMQYMFYGCEKFNQDLNSWNVSKVVTMYHAFYKCPTTPDWYDKDKWE